jgi:hypothetical protein
MSKFIDIYINERRKCVPAFCPICDRVAQTLKDAVRAYSDGGCHDCFITFLEPNRNIKGNDWEPDENEIKEWLLKKEMQFRPMYRFF